MEGPGCEGSSAGKEEGAQPVPGLLTHPSPGRLGGGGGAPLPFLVLPSQAWPIDVWILVHPSAREPQARLVLCLSTNAVWPTVALKMTSGHSVDIK